ncbi:MAG: DUF928 domain-containing protein [Symplocastrum torsivum CPER-KK1]|uniref:DUF928 domain-containing protein n=1 Tax=Symplocastrum torsivum CPER-KK1 TaxID=450513 RepID=A0A951UD63_9CYAN|nr:DUF928 domain-containing protein [Symplocastrum torsivum CPER-KK1]
MMYIKSPQQQKILAIALTVVGMYGAMSLSSRTTRAQAYTAISEFSPATGTYLSTSSLLLPGQAATRLVLNNSNNILVQLPYHRPEIQLAQAPILQPRGNPDPTIGGGTDAQDPTLPGRGNPDGRTFGGGSNVFPAPDEVAPGSRTGEASRARGGCPRVTTPLTALMPVTKGTSSGQSASTTPTTSESVYGLTVAERPTFWFYVPYPLTSSRPVEFVLQDEDGNDIYQTQFTESGTVPGVVGLQLPPTVDPLEVGKRYRWYFLIYCNPEEPTFVEGWVERVALNPTLKTQLDQATTPQQKADLYAQAGIWYEAVTTLAELRRQKPNDQALNAQWLELLQSVDLEAIATEPVTSVLTPE